MSHPQLIPAGSTGASFSSLQEFIPVYKEYLSQHFKDVNDGEDMLQLGAKTSLMQELERFMANPIEALVISHTTAANALHKFVEQFMAIFFKTAQEKGLVKNVFKISSDKYSLSYGVILNEDTFANRESVLDLLNLYYTFNFSEKVPVYFRFVPENLVSAFGDATYIV